MELTAERCNDVQADSMRPNDSLGIDTRDVRAIRKMKRTEALARPLIGLLSSVGGFVLGFALTAASENASTSYPYAVSFAAGATPRETLARGRRWAYLFIAVSLLVVGYLIGAVTGYLWPDDPIDPINARTYYGVYGRI